MFRIFYNTYNQIELKKQEKFLELIPVTKNLVLSIQQNHGSVLRIESEWGLLRP